MQMFFGFALYCVHVKRGRCCFLSPGVTRRCRAAHLCTKLSKFSFCVCKLNKLANTEVARKQGSKRFFHPSPHPSPTKFQAKRFYLLRLPLVVAKRRETLSVGRELCGRAMARCPCLAGKQRSCVSAQAEMCRAAMPGRPRRERPGAQCLRPRLRDVRV